MPDIVTGDIVQEATESVAGAWYSRALGVRGELVCGGVDSAIREASDRFEVVDERTHEARIIHSPRRFHSRQRFVRQPATRWNP